MSEYILKRRITIQSHSPEGGIRDTARQEEYEVGRLDAKEI